MHPGQLNFSILSLFQEAFQLDQGWWRPSVCHQATPCCQGGQKAQEQGAQDPAFGKNYVI